MNKLSLIILSFTWWGHASLCPIEFQKTEVLNRISQEVEKEKKFKKKERNRRALKALQNLCKKYPNCKGDWIQNKATGKWEFYPDLNTLNMADSRHDEILRNIDKSEREGRSITIPPSRDDMIEAKKRQFKPDVENKEELSKQERSGKGFWYRKSNGGWAWVSNSKE